jgi:hypothetical protein
VKIISTWKIPIFYDILIFPAVPPIATGAGAAVPHVVFQHSKILECVANIEQSERSVFKGSTGAPKKDKFGNGTCAVVAFYARIAEI